MRFVIESGAFHRMLGASSADIHLETTVAMVGDVRELTTAELVPTAASVD